MAGMNDNVPMIGDWLPPNLCPTSLFSNLMAEECSSRLISDVSSQKSCGGSLQESREQGIVVNVKNKDCEPGIQVSKELAIELDSFNVPKSNTRSGFSERIAGRAGFGNLTLDTSQIRTTRSFSSPTTDFRSPLLTIPPGLSPTMLLDSPIFLSSSLAELSPTTGKFTFMECDNVTDSAVACKTRDHSPDNVDPTPFAFKLPLAYFPSAEKMPALGIHHQLFLPNSVENPQQPNFQHGFSQLTEEKDSGGSIAEKKASGANISSGRAPLLDDIQGADPKGEITSASLGAPAEDGYNWRKYGQKQVKGSEYPRSYYKCTQPNCQVKKKVERSHEGHITEIIYKGAHSHDKPAPNRRSAIQSSHPSNGLQIGGSEQIGTAGHDWKCDGLDANQSAPVAIEQCDQSYPVQAHDGPYHETPDGVDASSTLSNDEDEDEQVTHGSASRSLDGDGDETESKRRKLDACALEMSAASRAVREPRVVVQTTSDVDILDDGYRWRKYGQKVVKGNPNPRSYYKCTSAGCTVRKHVERASHDLKSVITTYEGKHNHEVPAARTGSQASSAAASCITATASPSSSCLPQRKAESARMPDGLGLGRFDGLASVGSFGLPSRDQQLGAAVPNFSFAMAHQGLTHNFAMAGLGPISSLKMPVLPPLPAYMTHYRQLSRAGFMIPKAVPKEEPAADSGLPISGGSSVYQSLMRMPLEPQL